MVSPKTLSQRKAEKLLQSVEVISMETTSKPPAEIRTHGKKIKILHKQTGILPKPYVSVVKSLQITLGLVVALSQRQAA